MTVRIQNPFHRCTRRVLATALAVLATTCALASAHAQAVLNPRWHGTWVSDEFKLVITPAGLNTGERDCRWVAAKPKTSSKRCVAFYDAGVPKAKLTALFDDAERAINRLSADKQAPLAAADRKALLDDLARHRRVLSDISEDVFRSVALDSTELEGDCTTLYLLDGAHLYEVTTCPYPEAHSLRQYRKQP